MQNKRNIALIFLVIIILLGLMFSIYRKKPQTTQDVATTTPQTSKPITDEETHTINKAWAVFQDYLTAAKMHDLKTVTNLSYQLSSTCKDSSQINKCNELMDNAYIFGSEMKKSDYTNAWYDDKQIILFTKENTVSTTTVKGLYRGYIYFTKDSNGAIKFLSLNPEVGVYALTKDKTAEQVDAELKALVMDSDQDGLADAIETCRENALSTCKQTDPNKRDTNGNGWWDGIENLFYTKP